MRHARRNMLKAAAGAAATLPLVFFSRHALAAKNDAMRASLKYQATPLGTKQCSNCTQFVPGKTPKDDGGCKIMAGDTEISPTAYCIAWVELKK
jgi:hypothetical protein